MKSRETKGERSRLLIVETAIKLFSMNGFFETSIQNIAKECGVSQSAVFHHFRDKISLFEGILSYVVLKNHTQVSASFSIKDNAQIRLVKHCEENLKWALSNPDEAKCVILLYYGSTYDPKLKALNDRIAEVGRERIVEYIYAGTREGFFNKDLKVPKVAEVVHQWLIGAILQAITVTNRNDLFTLQEFKKSFSILLVGLLSEKT